MKTPTASAITNDAASLTSFHFSLGDSSSGPVGFCARVTARDAAQAIDILKKALARSLDSECSIPVRTGIPSVEYVNIYLNTDAITADSIDEEEESEDEDVDPDADQQELVED